MKRIVFILSVFFLVTSCDVGDDGSSVLYSYVAVQNVDIPDSFELGKTYDIEVEYVLPNDCFAFSGFEVFASNPNTRTVRPVAFTNQDNCPDKSTSLEKRNLKFQVIRAEDYLFKFLTGVDDQGQEVFMEFTVPVN